MATSIQQNIHTFLDDIRRIIDAARTNAVRSVDFCRVQMYWQMGHRILEEEQQGKDRADYGSYLIKNLAKQLQPEYGSGFSVRQLERCRQFYRLYPIASALRSQLNWTQYKMLITISDPNKREYYELETVNNCWTAREMERQINSQLYERLLLSNDKEAVLAVARKERIPQSPLEIIKDPMYLEFLGLERKPAYYEKDLESAIITHLQHFLLELGQGFTFVARQKRTHDVSLHEHVRVAPAVPPLLQRLLSVRIRLRIVLRHFQFIGVEFHYFRAGACSLALEVFHKHTHARTCR